MTVEEVKSHIHARPFQPLAFHLSDRTVFRVLHPEFVTFIPSNPTFIISYPGKNGYEVINVNQVVRIRTVPEEELQSLLEESAESATPNA